MNMHNKSAIEDWLKSYGQAVVATVTGEDTSVETVQVRALTHRRGATVVMLDVGEKRAVAKLFDPSLPESHNACQCEAFALVQLKDTGLAPALYTYAEEPAFIVSEFVAGDQLSSSTDAAKLIERAGLIGRWAADYISYQPPRQLDISWFEYMQDSKGIIDNSVADEARARFGDRTVGLCALAKHDMDLSVNGGGKSRH